MTRTPETSLYLSRLLLNPRSRQVMSEMAHPYEMHRTLMRAFPQVTSDGHAGAREELGCLFRADLDERQGSVKVYVQSRMEPDWTFLDRLDGYLETNTSAPGYEYKDVLPAYRELRAGQVLSFRLRANPTKRVARDDDPMKGKRVELMREDEQIAWLVRKGQWAEGGEPGAFEPLTKEVADAEGEGTLVPRVNVHSEGKLSGRKKSETGRHTTTHLAVVFEGLLRVTNANAFLKVIVRGIGSGKAFGFGLLSVAPSQ